MLRNICQKSIVLKKSSVFSELVKCSSFHTTRLIAQQEDTLEYEQDKSNGIKTLEKLGLAKAEWSWPKYNRTVFPPSEDGIQLVTPVKSDSLFLEVFSFKT